MVKLVLLVLCFMWVLEPNLYTVSVYLTALAMGLQDKVMLSLLGDEEATSMGGKTVEDKIRKF